MANVRLKRHYSLIAHSPDTIELRYGVWRPDAITLTDETGSGHLLGILGRLNGRFSSEEIAGMEGIPQTEVDAVIAQLSERKLIEEQSTHVLDYFLDHISPTLSVHEGKLAQPPVPVVLFGDAAVCKQIERILKSSSLQSQCDVQVANDVLRSLLLKCGASWLSDRLVFEQNVQPFAKWAGQLTVVGMTTVNPLEMHAFNRISLHFRIPWIHAVVDGPFLHIGPTIIPFRSACYECLEARILSNMRDAAGYQRYKLALAEGRITGPDMPLDTVLGAMLASLTAFEALNYLLTGAAFTVGKMLSIYLPSMGFTFNEVLRLPGCDACSPAPERDGKELYFDIRTMLDD